MDYFSELLESYSKLKKRTFKLTYISEETSEEEYAQAANVAKEFLQTNLQEILAANFQNPVELKTPTGVSISFWAGPAKSTGRVGAEAQAQDTKVIKAKSGVSFGEVGVVNGNNVEISSQLTSKGNTYKTFLGKFIEGANTGPKDAGQRIQQDAKTLEQQKQQEEEALAQQELREIGGWSRQNGVELTPDTIAALENAKKIATDYCKSVGNSETFKGFCAKIWSYFAAGSQNIGLEYKLGTAQGLAISDVDTGTTRKTKLSPGTIEQAARSAEFLISFLQGGDEEKCKQVTSRIGMFKGKQLVLFGQEPSNNSEAIVVGEPNALQRLALDRMSKECGINPETDLTKLVGDGISTNEKNAVRGTFFEEIIKFGANFRSAKTYEEKRAASTALFEALKSNKAVLQAIAAEADPESGATLDEEFDRFIQGEILAVLDSPEKLSNYVLSEIRAIQPILDFLDCDEVIHGGKTSLTGQRADVFFAYDDEAKARAKAKAVGSSVRKEGGRWVISAGLKRLQEMHGPKLGEINSQERLDGIATGRIQDRHIDAGFNRSMNLRQFNNNPGGDREEAMVAYADNLATTVNQATQQLIENRLYINAQGKLKSQKPSDVFSTLAKTLMAAVTPANIRTSLLGKALFNTDTNGNSTRKDFEGDGAGPSENRQRAREMVGRAVRMKKLKDDIEAGDQAARDYAIRWALVTGSNTQDMSQIIVDDSGEVVVLRHNEIFDLICNAENSENKPDIQFTESGYTITVQSPDGPLTVRVGQEMSKVTDANGNFVSCDTRTDCKLPTSTVRNKNLQGDISSSNNESTLHKFLEGQMKLLQEILNQSK